jgi:O-antigen ligase
VRPAPPRSAAPAASFLLLAALVASFPWDDALDVPSPTVSVVKLLGAALVGAYVLTTARQAPLRLPLLLLPVGLFLAASTASLLVSGDIGTGLPKLARYLLFGAFAFLLVQIATTRAQLIVLAKVFTVSAAVAGLVGLVSFFTAVTDRAAGPIGDANDFAYVLSTALPLALYLAWQAGRDRVLWVACSVALVAAILGTLSRGAVVALAVAGLWAVLTGLARSRTVLIVVLGVVAIVAVALTFERSFVEDRLKAKFTVADDNVESRQALWGGALEMAADRPLSGVGTGHYPERADEYVEDEPYGIVEPVAHNSYLEVLAEGGVLTFLPFAAFVAGTWVVLRRVKEAARTADDRPGVELASALQACHLIAAVGAVFLSVQIAPPLWLVGAMAMALASAGTTGGNDVAEA